MTTALLAPGESTFGAYRAFLARQRVAVLGGVLAGIVVATAVLILGPKTYAARAEVLVLGLVSGPAADAPATVNLDNEARVLTSTPVLQEAARRMGAGTDPRALEDAVEASVAANTTVLSITFRARDAEVARRGADALAAAYLADREASARARLDAALAWLKRERADVEGQLQQVILRLGTEAERTTDQATRTVLAGRLSRLRGQLAETAATVPLGGRLVSEAALPTVQRTPIPTLVLISGVMGGLLAGCALGGLRDVVSPRLCSAEDIMRRLGAPVLTVVDEATAHADLARLATLVIDESERAPSPVRSFLVAATTARVRGLADALGAALRDAGREAHLARVEVRTAVPVPAERTRVLEPVASAGHVPGLWDEEADAARARGEIVVIDGPADGAGVLAPMVADALIVVVDFGRTRPDQLQRAVAHLQREHHRLIGIVGARPAASGRSSWEAGP
jgi:capsular polysaccharide biosynthesis protein